MRKWMIAGLCIPALIVLLVGWGRALSGCAPGFTLAQARQAIGSARSDIADLLWWGSEPFAHSGQMPRVLAICDMVAELDPQDVEAHGQGAWLCMSLGDRPGAIARYQRGIKANPRHYRLYFELGMLHLRHHDPKAAEPYLRQAASLGGPMMVLRSYGQCLGKLGKRREALAVWQRVLKQCPGDVVAKREIARLSAGKGNR